MQKRWYQIAGIIVLFASVGVMFGNCSQMSSTDSGNSGANVTYYPPTPLGAPLNINPSATNVMPIQFNSQILNSPLATVKLCVPGTTTCQTIPNVLLDTGSTGLRLFSSAVSLSLPAMTSGNKAFSECYFFGSGMSFYGPVVNADVTLGGLTAANIHLQIVNSPSYSTPPHDCTNLNGTQFSLGTPSDIGGANGILGIQPFNDDCGPSCAPDTLSATYYTCTGSSCAAPGFNQPESLQVANPIAKMSKDNNGFIIQIPNIPYTGSPPGLAGAYLVMGIGTETNNVPSAGVSSIMMDANGAFTTLFDSQTLTYGFIDSGSYDYGFTSPPGLMPTCSDQYGDIFFCPNSTQSFTAGIVSNVSAGPQINLPFYVANAANIINASNNGIMLFNDLGDPGGGLSADGASASSDLFDWGLPVFFGKTIYFGMDTGTSTLGAGAFYAM